MLLLKNTVFVLSLNVILLNSEYSQAYFYCLNTSAENLSSNLFLILISMLFKKKKKTAKNFIHKCTVLYANKQHEYAFILRWLHCTDTEAIFPKQKTLRVFGCL